MTDQPSTGQELLTVEQIAEELLMSAQTIRNYIKSGALPAIQLKHVYRVKREDLDAMLSREQSKSAPLGSHRDPWAPKTLARPYRRRDSDRPPSIWDTTSAHIIPTKRHYPPAH
jgi:excisionase family DNA binding protein